MDDRAKQVDEHLREGLYFFSIGQVLEGRRLWRQALDLAPGHPVLEDYLNSTAKELTSEEQSTEDAEKNGISTVMETDSWDEEITGELDSLWGVQGDIPAQVSPPGEGGKSEDDTWELGPDIEWEEEEEEDELLNVEEVSAAEPGVSWGNEDAEEWSEETPTELGMAFDAGVASERHSEIDDFLAKANAALNTGYLTQAQTHLDDIFSIERGHEGALACFEALKTRAFQALIPSSIPQRIMDMDDIANLNFDMVEGYILSRIDGMTSVEDLYALIGHLDPTRVGEVLASFMLQSVIELKQ